MPGTRTFRLTTTRLLILALSGLLLCCILQLATSPRPLFAGSDPPVSGSFARPADGATIRFAQETISATIDVPLVLDLLVEGAEESAGWQVVFEHDPAQLLITSVAPGGWLAGQGRTETVLGPLWQGGGRVAAGGYTYGPLPGVSGSGVLARISLTPRTVGSAALTINGAMLAGLNSSGTLTMQPVVATGIVVVVSPPLASNLARFDAVAQADGIRLTWETVSELDAMGYNLYRADSPAGPLARLAFVPSQAPGSSQGFAYTWLDRNVLGGETYYYWLETVSPSGATTLHGPVSASYQMPAAVSLRDFSALARPAVTAVPWLAALLTALLLSVGAALWRRRSKSAQKD